jgi:DNA (cytosine-5)-methyltransferase 1
MRVLDLFSGIGGFSLGLERAGMTTVAFCEIDPFCRAVLKKHWPDVPQFEDVRKLRGEDVGPVDLVCGGYPCQPFSTAGKRGGAEDDRHLWPEMFRIISELRPTWVLGENVAGHITLGLDEVLSDLDALGYASRAFVISACAVDAPHRRDRVWIVAHSNVRGEHAFPVNAEVAGAPPASTNPSSAIGKRVGTIKGRQQRRPSDGNWWPAAPGVSRVDDGLPDRTHRIRSLGNSIVPQVAEEIGRAIMRVQHD